MQLPQLTPDQIQERCTEQSFTRGLEYFHAGAIGNPTLHGYTLSATCEGTDVEPYRLSVELMPTGITATDCSCPYDWEGDCKHIVALLLTYIHAPDTILFLELLLDTLEAKPKSSLLQVISELLKRAPELAPIVQAYSDIPFTPPCPGPLPLVTIYREQIDNIFGGGFLEQHQLHHVLSQLEDLRQHAESLAQLDETESALSILHALIHQSIARYSDTLQNSELPRFVDKCTQAFAQIAMSVQEPAAIFEHCRMLLRLSFETERVFTPLLTHLLEQLCLTQEVSDLQGVIEQRLDESLDRQAHVRLLLALYFQSGRTEDYLRLARSEGEGYRLIHALFTYRQADAGWKALEAFPLSVDEYWCLLHSPIVQRAPQFIQKLLNLLGSHQTDTAITLYRKLIDRTVLSRKREDYEKVQGYLTQLKTCYQQLDQDNQWSIYLTDFRKRHARKGLLLKIIAECDFTS
jgi:hypothetical protein